MDTLVLILFVMYERKPEQPVLPYRLFGSVTAVTSLFSAFLHGAVVYNLNTYSRCAVKRSRESNAQPKIDSLLHNRYNFYKTY
jgi:hypothetical protein